MKIRQWVQWFIGVLSLEKKAKERHQEVFEVQADLMASLSRAFANLYEADEKRHNELCERLGRLESVFADQHVAERRRPQAVAYDWEQVQAQELAEMLKNPPKDEN